MATCPITSWQIDGETMETVTDFIFLGSKITVDGDFQGLPPWKKSSDNLGNILKSRDITLPTCRSSQSYGFSNSHVWI